MESKMNFEYEENELSNLVSDVKEYALRNYNKDGWDICVECYSDDDIASIIYGAVSERVAISKMKNYLGSLNEYRSEIMSEAW
tara:strand:+ start:1657 stop:1905 length:249 start_codon:yes stop_codon:yes gene_type:complete